MQKYVCLNDDNEIEMKLHFQTNVKTTEQQEPQEPRTKSVIRERKEIPTQEVNERHEGAIYLLKILGTTDISI